jgi:hypothetical protein
VILRHEWKSHVRLILSPALRRLKLFRPDAIDLVLTKMMRGEDPQDLDDIRFLISSEGLTKAVILKTGMATDSRRHSGELCMKAVAGMGEFRCPNGAPHDSLGQRPRKRLKTI